MTWKFNEVKNIFQVNFRMVTFDEVIDYAAGDGFFHIFLLLVVTGVSIPSAILHTGSVFLAYTPGSRCYVDIVDNMSYPWAETIMENVTLYWFIPWNDQKQVHDTCSRKVYNMSSCSQPNAQCVQSLSAGNHTYDLESCDDGYVYDKSIFQSTVVTEWDLVCERTILKATLTSIYFLGVFVGSVVGGALSDSFGRLKMFRISCVSCLLITVVCGFSPNLIVFAMLQFISGAFAMCSILSSVVYAVEVSQENWRIVAGTAANAFFGIGCVVFSVVAYFIRDWRHLEFAISSIYLPFIVIGFWMVESPRWLYGRGKTDEARSACHTIARRNGIAFKDDIWDDLEKEPLYNESGNRIVEIFRRPYCRYMICSSMFLWMVTSMVYFGLALNSGALGGDIFLNNALGGLVEVSADIILFFVVLKHGVRDLLPISLYTASVACLASTVVMQFRGGNVVLETVGSILVMIGRFGISGSFACIYIQGPQLFPTSGRTTAIGLCSMAARIGAIITPFSLQAQMDIPWLTPVIFGVAAFIAATISLTFPKTSGKQLTSNFTQAEQFFKSHFHTNVFTKLPFLKSDRSAKKSEETEIMMKKITSQHKNKECV